MRAIVIPAHFERPPPAVWDDPHAHPLLYFLVGPLIAIDILLGSFIPGARHYQSISCRVGLSIMHDGWASKVRWPSFMRNHFIGSVFKAVV